MIEAMVSVAIVGILAALAAPAFRNMSERMATSTVAEEMVATISITRNTAVQSNGNVVLQKLTEAQSGRSAGTCATTQNWSCGWRVFRDPNGNNILDAGEELIYTFAITNNVVVMRSANGASLTANRWGQLAGANAVGFAISPLDNPALEMSTVVCLNSGGRTRVVPRSVACPA